MRFADLLRATVLASATGASVLILAAVVGLPGIGDAGAIDLSLGWWCVAAAIGYRHGRRAAASEAIASLLAAARTQASLPEANPAATLLNRLWPLLIATPTAAGAGVLTPQIPAVVGGFMLLWALAWRRQPDAVRAIEDRDGARFYVAPVRFWQAIRLLRTPGFRA